MFNSKAWKVKLVLLAEKSHSLRMDTRGRKKYKSEEYSMSYQASYISLLMVQKNCLFVHFSFVISHSHFYKFIGLFKLKDLSNCHCSKTCD